ncbi:hypothetical protein AB4Y77_08880 [Paenarthrobacter sp. YAF11_1]
MAAGNLGTGWPAQYRGPIQGYTQPETPLEELESYYGPSYAERMYRD